MSDPAPPVGPTASPLPPVAPPGPPPPTTWAEAVAASASAPGTGVTAGALVARTFEVWWRHLGRFAVMMLIVFAPLAVMGLVAGLGGFFWLRDDLAARDLPAVSTILALVAVGLLVAVPVGVAVVGGVMAGTAQHLAGRPVTLGAMLRQGSRRIVPLFLVGLLVGLSCGFATLALVVPGIMVYVATLVAMPAAAVEGGGAMDAYRRSLDLTEGSRWTLLGAALVVLAFNTGVGAIGGVLQLVSPIAGVAVRLALSVLTGALAYVFPAVAYHALRTAKEGGDTTVLARVFE